MHSKNSKGPAYPEPVRPIEVRVEGSFEEANKRFKSAFQKERVISRLKEKESYEKPSDKKRRKHREAIERRMMQEAREKLLRTGEWERRMKKRSARKQRKLEDRLRRQQESDNE